MNNEQLASHFRELADLLELAGENPFKIRAYRGAVRTLRTETRAMTDRLAEAEEDLTALPGIGKELAAKIAELVETGRLQALDKARSALPEGLPALLRLEGLGPKKVRRLYDELGIDSLESLEQAINDGKIRQLKGFGEKSEQAIQQALMQRPQGPERFLRSQATELLTPLLAALRATPGVVQVEPAGSYRRARDTVGDLDILVASEPGVEVMPVLLGWPGVQEVIAGGETKTSVRMGTGLQVDLRVVPPASFGAALHYFTGSMEHNIRLRRRAQDRSLKVNEYGVFDGDSCVGGATEAEVFAALDLPWMPPEIREDRGEWTAAEAGDLPRLVTVDDIRGDLHAHTTYSDGLHSIREMAEAARERGYAYLAITDHSQRLTVAHGLDAERLRDQGAEIDRVRGEVDGLLLLKGIEVDILEDGSLDLDDDVLGELDLVIASVHSRFKLDVDRQTERILRAMDHPRVTLLGHPTGRLLLSRPPYEVDMERIIDHAAQRGTVLEINANPRRLDLNDQWARLAVERGCTLAVNTDAHRVDDFDLMGYGIGQARRAWVEAQHLLNTMAPEVLLDRLSHFSV